MPALGYLSHRAAADSKSRSRSELGVKLKAKSRMIAAGI
jgi:hypothetical protein